MVCLITFSGNAWAAIFTVGTGAGCTHGTIQSALNAAAASAGADTVRLTRSLTYEPTPQCAGHWGSEWCEQRGCGELCGVFC